MLIYNNHLVGIYGSVISSIFGLFHFLPLGVALIHYVTSKCISGKHPNYTEKIAEVRACVKTESDSCAQPLDLRIKVRKCPGYYVYRLAPTRMTDTAYCAGNMSNND